VSFECWPADPPDIDGARERNREAKTIRDGNRALRCGHAIARGLFSKKEFALEALDLNDATGGRSLRCR